jgi:hypothetical protein
MPAAKSIRLDLVAQNPTGRGDKVRNGSGTDGKACPQLRQLFPEAATGGYKVGNQFPHNSVRGRQIANQALGSLVGPRFAPSAFTNAWRRLTIES